MSRLDYSNHPLCRSLASPQEYTYNPEHIGSGSFGTVYSGRFLTSPPDEENIVVKVVCPTSAGVGEHSAPNAATACYRTFSTLREIFLQYGCCHPCLVRLRCWNVLLTPERDDIQIVFDRFQGGSVVNVLNRLTAAEQRIILYGTALAVQYLHRYAILHRDIKPDNILLNEFGYPCLHDLGFAKVCRSPDQTLPLGCPQYRSPEMGDDKVEYSFPSDIYALAITFCAVLNGSEWNHGLPLKVLYQKVAEKNFRPPFNKSVTKVQRDLIEAMWLKDPGERPVIDDVVSRLAMQGMFSGISSPKDHK
jgi:serine/threonine protein kinase